MMLDISGLNHSFGKTKILHDLNFSVKKGEILGFLGPNGAGKSTTMKIITGYLRPDGGRVSFGGLDIRENPMALRTSLGYLPEAVPTYPELRVDEYLLWVARIKMSDDPVKEARQALERCGLAEVSKRLIRHLSRGFRQRVGLAQAILGPTRLLILDEPTVGLDPGQIREIRELITELGQEKTIILSTHILPEVELTCDRVLIINQGHIVAEDTPKGLVARVGCGARYMLRLDIPGERHQEVLASLEALDCVATASVQCHGDQGCAFYVETGPDGDHRVEVTRHVFDMGWPMQEFKLADMSLEEVFMHIVRNEFKEGGDEC